MTKLMETSKEKMNYLNMKEKKIMRTRVKSHLLVYGFDVCMMMYDEVKVQLCKCH